jgi:hypothetical protein
VSPERRHAKSFLTIEEELYFVGSEVSIGHLGLHGEVYARGVWQVSKKDDGK